MPPTEKDQTPQSLSTGSGSRRAAAEDEHVVSRGEKGGQVISTSRVLNGEPIKDASAAVDNLSFEHHADPPNALNYEGDVVMDVEDQCEPNPVEGGEATRSV